MMTCVNAFTEAGLGGQEHLKGTMTRQINVRLSVSAM
jgi:hypothetical protein